MHHRKVYKYGPFYSNHTDFREMDLHPLHTRLFSTTVTTRSTLMEKTQSGNSGTQRSWLVTVACVRAGPIEVPGCKIVFTMQK
jgi:hypothetical protein